MRVPTEPADDPQRGPRSPRYKPWTAARQGTTRFDWVPLESSLQWRAFQEVIDALRKRHNDVFVLFGPLNEHMIAEDNRLAFHSLRQGIMDWLKANQVSAIAPETLPSDLYADASHPLTEGYRQLAQELLKDDKFRAWLDR